MLERKLLTLVVRSLLHNECVYGCSSRSIALTWRVRLLLILECHMLTLLVLLLLHDECAYGCSSRSVAVTSRVIIAHSNINYRHTHDGRAIERLS